MANTRYLSILINQLVPEFFRERYPKYELFIKTFLEYLEEGPLVTTGEFDEEGLYRKVVNVVDNMDIDKIDVMSNTTMRTELIDALYVQMVGDVNAQHLSELLDEILFLRHQTSLNYAKATKATFQFLFAIILGGSVTITEILNQDKRHDGEWQYNGYVMYNHRPPTGVNPFIYLVESNFNYAKFKDILDWMNPAGMLPIVLVRHVIKTDYIESPMTENLITDGTFDDANNWLSSDVTISGGTANFSIQTIYDDWFLPSTSELFNMYNELYLYGVGGFSGSFASYWSSTESVDSTAEQIYFGDGNMYITPKASSAYMYTRAARSFTSLTPYNLRDTGPAGGLIFITPDTIGNSTGKYFEAAPVSTEWNGKAWGVNGVLIGTGSTIGSGQSNTDSIIAIQGMGSTYSPQLCDGLSIINSGLTGGYIYQRQPTKIYQGVSYKLSFDVSDYTQGTLRPKLGNGLGKEVTSDEMQTGGTLSYEDTFICDGDSRLTFQATDFAGKIDNVVLTRNTYLTEYEDPNFYVAMYDNSDNFLGMIKPAYVKFANITTGGDKILSDGTVLETFSTSIPQDATVYSVLMEIKYNQAVIPDGSTISKIKFLRQPIVNNAVVTSYYSTTLDSEGDVNAVIDLTQTSIGEILSENNMRIQILFTYGPSIPQMEVSNSWVVA